MDVHFIFLTLLTLNSTSASDLNRDVSDLESEDIKVLQDWITKLEAKYPIVGYCTNAPNYTNEW